MTYLEQNFEEHIEQNLLNSQYNIKNYYEGGNA